ncbi:hypothetical protein K1719_036358 [Acacia pycnantha]|nr:hypothetical protein K1719_036358 [Acacia pycnantha]
MLQQPPKSISLSLSLSLCSLIDSSSVFNNPALQEETTDRSNNPISLKPIVTEYTMDLENQPLSQQGKHISTSPSDRRPNPVGTEHPMDLIC